MPSHERIVAVQGLQNYRDLGGYLTHDGKHVVKYKHIYRADNIGCVTDAGMHVLLDKLRLKFAIDFRCNEERNRAPYRCDRLTYFPIPIDACSMRDEVLKQPMLDGATAEALLRRIAKTFLIDFKEAYRKFFHILLNDVKGQPAVFHCTAGKDRTGVAAALLLTALDVPPSTVMEDFLLTNQCCVPPSYETLEVGNCVISQEAVNVLFRAHPFFLELCFAGVRERYGSLTAYMEKELQLGRKELQVLRGYYVRATSSRT